MKKNNGMYMMQVLHVNSDRYAIDLNCILEILYSEKAHFRHNI